MDFAVATRDGIRFLSGDHVMKGHETGAMASDGSTVWFVADHREIWRAASTHEPEKVASSADEISSLVTGAVVYAGTEGAHLLAVRSDTVEQLASFEAAEDRDAWYTPWGGPPAVRSLARSPDGVFLANVHVGGILRSDDEGASWTQTIDIDTDVHHVVAPRADLALAATGAGFAISRDGGSSWTFDDEGLDHTYCRAVALSGETIILSASSSHTGRNAALWRRPVSLARPFERCGGGFPEHVSDNIDTSWIAPSDDVVAAATPAGEVYVSHDEGASWSLAADGLDGVSCVAPV